MCYIHTRCVVFPYPLVCEMRRVSCVPCAFARVDRDVFSGAAFVQLLRFKHQVVKDLPENPAPLTSSPIDSLFIRTLAYVIFMSNSLTGPVASLFCEHRVSSLASAASAESSLAFIVLAPSSKAILSFLRSCWAQRRKGKRMTMMIGHERTTQVERHPID